MLKNIAPGTMLVATKKYGSMFSAKIWNFNIDKTVSKLNYRSIAIVIRHHPTTPQFIEVITNLGTHGWVSTSAIEEARIGTRRSRYL